MRAVPLLVILFSSAAATPLAAQSTTVTNGVFETVKQTQSSQVDSTTQATDVKFRKDINDRMTVSVRLSGTPFRFLVDTGADRTAISRDVAARLGLAAGDTASLHSMTGVSTVQTATVPNLEFSNSDMRIVDAPLLDATNMGADGILGTDSLHSQRVIFDFDKNLMTIVPAEQKIVPKDEGTIVVTGRMKNGRLIVTDATADDNRITVILDTGSEVSVGNEALRERLGNHGQLRETGSVQLQSVTGDLLTGEYTFVKNLVIGDVGLSNLAVVFADAHTFKQLGLDKRPALLLGMNALRAFKKVSIDFANRKLRVMLPETGSLDAVRFAAR
jgi:predicted aspartyl protease